MRMSKIIAGMSAIALAAAVAVPVTADEAPVENGFYNATGTWNMTYSGSTITNGMVKEKDPASDWKPSDDATAQLVGYTNEETGATTWNLGFNMQVGHMKKAKVTVHVTSNHANILNDGPDGEASTEGYMYTVQASWNGDSSADFQEGWTHEYNEDGSKKMANGACDVNGWNSGSTKYNGNWIQISLNDDDVSALTFDVTVQADDKTTWEYHPYDASKEANEYEIFRFGCAGLFLADSISGDGNEGYPAAKAADNGQGGTINSTFVDSDYINAQFGGVCSPSGDESSSEGDGDSSNGDSSNGDSSNGDSSNGSSSNGGGSSSNGGSNGGGGSNKNGGGSTGGSTSTSSTGDGEAASDATENADSGAAAGVGFAIAALAGAAVVVSRKR